MVCVVVDLLLFCFVFVILVSALVGFGVLRGVVFVCSWVFSVDLWVFIVVVVCGFGCCVVWV